MGYGMDEFRRIQMIDEYFASGKKASVKELAQYFDKRKYDSDWDNNCGFSEKILYKVIKAMKEELNVPLEKDPDGRMYYCESKTLTKPGFLSREETGKTIRLINGLLETIRDTPVYEKASELCQEITKEAPLMDRYGKEVKEDRIYETAVSRVVFLGAPASCVRDSIWADIYKAMEGNYHIVIEYASSGHSESIERGVRPYQLIFDDGIWDLWGYDCKKRKKLLYNLSRIKNVTIRKDADRFILPEDFDFHSVTPGTFGCFCDPEEEGMTRYKIWLKKDSYAETFCRERVWGLNPSVKPDRNGTVIEFEDNQYLPILRWVMGWGPDARPIEPKRLVDDWKDMVFKTYGNLGKSE
ncbi:MAG: WYL domain-containing protein [Treponema sp.]|nr:WYL domain-containing protein [Treponema sp.]